LRANRRLPLHKETAKQAERYNPPPPLTDARTTTPGFPQDDHAHYEQIRAYKRSNYLLRKRRQEASAGGPRSFLKRPPSTLPNCQCAKLEIPVVATSAVCTPALARRGHSEAEQDRRDRDSVGHAERAVHQLSDKTTTAKRTTASTAATLEDCTRRSRKSYLQAKSAL
jgi:hypothetical protein